MKKTLISALALGITLSSISVFAESDDYMNLYKREDSKKERMGIMPVAALYGIQKQDDDDESNDDSRKRLAQAYMSVTDDVRIPASPEVGGVSVVSERPETIRLGSLSRIKARATQLIRERIHSLETNRKIIAADKKLTAEQKTSLTGVLSANVVGLTALSASIASSTDATTTKELTNSIYTNFRIYGVVIPQVRLEKRIYDLQNHSVKLSDTFLKTQAKIDAYKAKGRDVTAWQKSLEDAKILVANDMNSLANLLIKVKALTPADYGTTSKMVIETTNKEIKRIALEFNSIAKNLNKSKTLKVATGTSTPVLPPLATSTPTTGSSTTGSTLTQYTLAQVAAHSTPSDCWIVVSGKVYSVAGYISMHPGGSLAITNNCGKDATAAFDTRGGSGPHSSSARATLGSFLVGTL